MIPTQNADSVIRSLFSVGSSVRHARSGSPRMFSSVIHTSSRYTSHDPRARMPSFGISRMVTPLVLAGRMNSETPWCRFRTVVTLTRRREHVLRAPRALASYR